MVGTSPLGKTYAPGKRGRDAIVSIAGGKAAKTSDSVANGCRGRCEIEHCEGTNLVNATLPHECE